MTSPTSATSTDARHAYIIIVGAGFSGVGMAIHLKQQGINDFILLERGDDLGGTWRDNTYPGCACDVPSQLYSFSFALNPDWGHVFSPQREIWAYLRDCAARYGILPHIRSRHEVRAAAWDEATCRWRLTTTQGDFTGDILILGQGPLSEPATPAIPGIESFAGTLFHSAQWDHDHDLRGERVAVIGTGASAIQIVPQIQPQVGHLILFQRTPPWIVPRLDRPVPRWRRRLYRAVPLTQRLARTLIYWQREFFALGFVYRPQMMRSAERIAAHHLRRQVPDPELRAKLTPHYQMGCKRILVSDDFYPAVTQPNVTVETAAIHEVRPHSIVTAEGREYAVDTIICATGFHVTDMPIAPRVRGRAGVTLADAWREGIQAYLGTTVAGFPNMFLLIGPNTGLGHTSMILMMEAQFAYITDALRMMAMRQVSTVEVQPAVQQAYNASVQRKLQGTVWLSGCASWYLDANGRNTTLWPGFTWEFRRKTRHFDADHYNLIPQRVAREVAVTG
jgi:cation diffusion facilitator CzcD-associated flavoprotein CzcO